MRRRYAIAAKYQPAPRVQEVIAELDVRGAWTEEGNIGKSDKVIQVLAARDMVLQVSKQTIP